MKNLIFILTFCAMHIFTLGLAQQNVQVCYQEVITLDVQLPDNVPDGLRNQIPNQRINFFDLSILDEKSYYRNSEGKGEGDFEYSSGDENEEFNFKIAAPKLNIYTDRRKNEHVESREFLGKKFLIMDKCKTNTWKISEEVKTVLDIPCVKATDGENLTVWFAPSINLPHGPNGLGGLPGLILALEDADRNIELIATEIKKDVVVEDDLVKPEKGKKVSRDEYNAIVDKKMEEMGSEGGGGVRIITIEEED